MRKIALILLLFVSLQETFAEDITWHKGSLVLKNTTVLTGAIAINQEYDLVLFKSNDGLTIYPANKVRSFQYYDESVNINRKFTSIQQKVSALTTHRLYEIVLVGEISVLRELSSRLADENDHRDGYNYFVQFFGEHLKLHHFRSKVFPYLLKTCESLQRHIRKNRLNPNNRAHAILIIEFYNQEFRSTAVIASN